MLLQELGEPIITIPAAIQNKSYYNPPGMNSHETLIHVGHAETAVNQSPMSIKGAR